MNGAQIVYDIFYLVIFNIVVAGMEFNFFLRLSEHSHVRESSEYPRATVPH